MSIWRSGPSPEFTNPCGWPVQRRPVAGGGVDEDHRDPGAAVLVPLELAAHSELVLLTTYVSLI